MILFQMSKKIGKLEKETVDWQGRWTSSNKALITMAEDVSCNDDIFLFLFVVIHKLHVVFVTFIFSEAKK